MSYDTDDFEQDVIERSYRMPVLVDFWAEWCGPCRTLGPTLEKLAEQHQDEWALVKLNTEKHPQPATQYGVKSIPNVKLFVDGKVADEFVGALPEGAIIQWLQKALPSPYKDHIKEAIQLLSENKGSEGQGILKQVVEAEPGNEQARILLAQTMLYADPEDAAEMVKPIEPGSEFYDLAEATQTFSLLFRYLDDTTSLPDHDMKETYLDAIRQLREQDYPAALEGFIEVIRRDRYYDDDGSRKACIAIFKSVGESHEITKQYRSKFSSALYV